MIWKKLCYNYERNINLILINEKGEKQWKLNSVNFAETKWT